MPRCWLATLHSRPKRRIVREMGGPQRLVRPPQPRDFAAQLPDVAYERGDRVAIVAGVIPTLTYTSALRVSINHPPAQNSRRLLQIGLTQLGSYHSLRNAG